MGFHEDVYYRIQVSIAVCELSVHTNAVKMNPNFLEVLSGSGEPERKWGLCSSTRRNRPGPADAVT